MKTVFISSLLMFLLTLLLTSCGSDDNTISPTPTPSYISSCQTSTGTGYLSKKNGIWILNLQGNYSDMGIQYGTLVKDQIKELYNNFDSKVHFDNPVVQTNLQLMKSVMDNREKQLLTGISSATGLTFDQVEFVNISLLFLFVPQKSGSGCSAFGATASQTKTGFTIVGRNWDNGNDEFAPLFIDKIALIVYNPVGQTQGSHKDNSVACLTPIGWFFGMSVINSKGLYFEYNNGMLSIPEIDLSIQDGVHQNLYAAFDCDTLEDVDARYLNSKVAVATITQVADKNRVWHYERSPFENSKKLLAGQAKGGDYYYDNPTDMDIFSNIFFFTDWKNQQFKYTSPSNDAPSRAIQRLINLQNLAKQNLGKVDVDVMKTVMTTSVTNGGPFCTNSLAETSDLNFFTSVGDLNNMTFHVIPNINALNGNSVVWSELDLKSQFKN